MTVNTLPDTLEAALLPHQHEAVDWLVRTPKALLADDVGLGKTIEVVAAIAALKDVGQLPPVQARVIWVTEAALIEPTREKFTEFAPALTVVTESDPLGRLDGKAQQTLRFAPRSWDVYLVSYGGLKGLANLEQVLAGTSMYVLDEVMMVKGAGKRQRAIRELTAGIPRVIAMTATPLENDLRETFAVLRVMHVPDLWTQGAFEQLLEWQEAYELPSGQVVPAKALGILPDRVEDVRRFLAKVMLRRTAEDAGLTLPVRVGEQYRFVQLTDDQQREYDSAGTLEGLSAFYQKEKAGRLSASGQSSLVDELLSELTERRIGQKVIVYCETLDVLTLAAERLAAAGLGHRLIDGQTKIADRALSIAEFRDNPDVDVLLGSSVLERGLDLQFCRVLISLDSSFNPQREHQREGRIRRIGSPHETYEHLTLLPDTPLTRRKIVALERKEGNAAALGVGR